MGLPTLRPLPGILLAVTVLAELGAVGLSWGLEPAWDTLLYALCAAVDRRHGGADPLAPSSPRRRLAVVRPRSC